MDRIDVSTACSVYKDINVSITNLFELVYAAINRHHEFTLLKGCQRFDAISMSNFQVYKF